MTPKPNYSRLVWRLVLQLLASAALGWMATYILLAVAASLYHNSHTEVRKFMKLTYELLNSVFGETALLFLGSFLFSIIFMVLFSWRRFAYIGELNRSLAHIADGNFGDSIPVRQVSELGDLADQTNRLVERLQRSLDEERRAEQTKNELITNVSHDLRTPLTSILGYLGLVEQDRYRDEVELRHYISIAYDKAQRLHVLINDLFEYTRMLGGSVPLHKVRVNLNELIGQLIVHHRIGLKEAGMEAELSSAGAEAFVMGDPDKLMRVFENLLTNAIAYGKEGRRIDFSVAQTEERAIVEVVNYGEPIPSTDLPYIFDRFYRVDKSRAEHRGGSGLGLAIVKSLVELHGGRIEAESDGSRTLFRVSLPQQASGAP